MSTIRPDSNLTRTADLESLGSRSSLDALRQRDQGTGATDDGVALHGADLGFDQATLEQGFSAQGPAVDAGESVLNASAWDDMGSSQRLLPGDRGFEALLGGLELSAAADSAANAVLAALD